MATGGFLEAMPEVSRAEVPETIFRQPPDQAVAFALCVIKSKPDDLSIRGKRPICMKAPQSLDKFRLHQPSPAMHYQIRP